MKNIKFFAMMAAALTIGLTSCNKGNNDIDNGTNLVGGKNVTLALIQGAPETRSIGESANDNGVKGKYAELSSGQVIFVKNGAIKFVYKLVTTATNLAAYEVNINALTTGYGVTFEKVDGTHVYVLGNKTILGLGNGDDFATKVQGVVCSQVDLKAGDYKTAVLFGGDVIKKVSVTPNPNAGAPSDYYCNLSIAPIASRMEIKKLTETGGLYSYEVAGIYINNVYENMTVSGTGSNINLNLLNGSLDTYYTGTTSTWHDRYTVPATGNPLTPGGTNVWAYNFFPAKNTLATDDNIPHIIVHLKNVTLKAGNVLKFADYYLTYQTYGGSSIFEFKAGNLYTVEELKFNLIKDGDIIIETNKFNCDVKVTILDWKPNVIVPNVN